jgi:hypothetical protein
VRGKLGDLPTLKVEPAALQNYARKIDAEVQAIEGTDSPNAAEIDVVIDFTEEAGTGSRKHSTVRPVPSLEGMRMQAVPLIAVSKEDLSWFEIEPEAMAVLAKVDGHHSVAEIIGKVGSTPERTVELLKSLEEQRVIILG